MFENRHISAYFADPVGLKVGYKDSTKAMFELRRLRTFDVAELRANRNIIKWEALSLETEDVAAINAAFIAEMLKAAATSVAFKDKNYTRPTAHALRYWKYFDYNSLPNVGLDIEVEDICFYSPPGSLGFYSLSVDSRKAPSNPVEFIEALLRNFWSRLNIDFSLSPKDRFESFLNKIQFDVNYLKQSEEQALLMLESGNYIFNREGIKAENIKDLHLKLLLGEVNDCIVSELDALLYYLKNNSNHSTIFSLSNINDNPLTNMLTKIVQSAPPAGTSLILQAFIVEGFYKLAKITKLIEPTLTKNEFLLKEDYEEQRLDIVKNLSLVLDSLNGLSILSTTDWARQTQSKIRSLLLYFLSTTKITDIKSGEDYRLPLFDSSITVTSYNDLLLSAGDLLNITLKAPVSNSVGDLLSISAKSYVIWGILYLDILYLTKSKKPTAVNIWLLPLSDTVTFEPLKTTVIANQTKTISIIVSGIGYGGVIAINSNSNTVPDVDNINNTSAQSNTLAFENNLNE